MIQWVKLLIVVHSFRSTYLCCTWKSLLHVGFYPQGSVYMKNPQGSVYMKIISERRYESRGTPIIGWNNILWKRGGTSGLHVMFGSALTSDILDFL